MRTWGTTTTGHGFSQNLLPAVWAKGRVVPNYEPSEWRYDVYGTPIRWSDYGQTTQHGWEVDHIVPACRRGSDALQNLQPLQWQNNRTKGDKV
jgi:hypothetical protein